VSSAEVPVSRVDELLADKYRIIRFIGEGGMGTVYEAQHTVVGRRFAVKFLHSELAKEDEILERFRREARAAGALESENIAQVVDFGHAADGIPYIVMEFLVGEDLAQFLAREGPLPLARAVNIIIQACRGLDAAHAAGIIHRDLKPENLFVCRRGDGSDLIKILDFGIAKLALAGVDGEGASVTRTGSTMGTPFYMSPEQARGAKDVDHRVDVYGLGVILFEALSGQKPHPGDSYNAILYHILTQAPTPIATLRAGLPDDLTDILQRSLAFNPSDRPATVMALAQALSRHAGRQVTPLRSQFDLRVTRSSAPDSEPSPSVANPRVIAEQKKGHKTQWLVACLVLALAGTATTLVLRDRQHEPARALAPIGRVPNAVPGEDLTGTSASVAPAAAPVPAVPPNTVKPIVVTGSSLVPASEPAAGNGNTSGERPAPALRQANRLRAKGVRHSSSHHPTFDPENPYQ
jgi:serine/threonine protein kinase